MGQEGDSECCDESCKDKAPLCHAIRSTVIAMRGARGKIWSNYTIKQNI